MAQPGPGRRAPCVSPTPAFSLAILTLGVVRPAWGGNGNARRQRNNLDLRGNMGDVGDGLTEPDAATGSNHGQGSNGRRINDDDYQDVNITNIDPDSPSATGMWEEGVD